MRPQNKHLANFSKSFTLHDGETESWWMFVLQHHSSRSTWSVNDPSSLLFSTWAPLRGQSSGLVHLRQGCTTPVSRLALKGQFGPDLKCHPFYSPSPLITLTAEALATFPNLPNHSEVSRSQITQTQMEKIRKQKRVWRRWNDSVRLSETQQLVNTWRIRTCFQSHSCTVVSRK